MKVLHWFSEIENKRTKKNQNLNLKYIKITKILNLEPFSKTVVICSNFISQRATKARIIANCLVAVILIIALQISFIIESLEVPKNLCFSLHQEECKPLWNIKKDEYLPK